MRIGIENELLKVEIESVGAELKSIVKKANQQEYMWEADPAYWGKTSPNLFPFIGKLVDCTYRYEGNSYVMDKHGFVKDMEFEVAKKDQDRVVLAVESNEQTLAKYPFAFRFEVEYLLEGTTLVQNCKVVNKDDKTMYFCLGGHPGFACPLIQDGVRTGKRTDCFVKLYGVDGKEELEIKEVDLSAGMLSGKTLSVKVKDGVFPITDGIFDGDALIFASQGVTAAALLDAEGREYVRLEAPTCPVWGIWSMPTSDAPYVCFEPWWGVCDTVGFEGTVQERPYMNQAAAGEVWQESFKIVIED